MVTPMGLDEVDSPLMRATTSLPWIFPAIFNVEGIVRAFKAWNEMHGLSPSPTASSVGSGLATIAEGSCSLISLVGLPHSSDIR